MSDSNDLTLEQIRQKPTTVSAGPDSGRVHESVLRSFWVVEKVRKLLAAGTPHEVVIEIIDDLWGGPHRDHEIQCASIATERRDRHSEAVAVADDICTTDGGCVASRIVLLDRHDKDIGSWHRDALVELIARNLSGASKF